MSTVTCLAEVKKVPNERIVEALEIILARAKSGEIRGFVALLNLGDGCSNYSVGECSFTDVLAAFEDWKFGELAARNLICTVCGNGRR